MSKVISFKAVEDMVKNLDESVEEENFTSRGKLLRSIVRNVEDKKLSKSQERYRISKRSRR